jgi:cysteine desulfurase family protein (TIGR01976 family)
MESRRLDVDFARSQFPALAGDWIFLDNAGGSQVLRAVADRVRGYLLSTSVQTGATYEVSRRAAERVQEGVRAAALLIGADPGEVVLGPSSTQLLINLARSMEGQLGPGDEIVVTHADHEANISPWLRHAPRGVEVKVWRPRASLEDNSPALDLDDLDALMTPRTRLVCFTQASNIFGTIHPAEEITRFVHERGAKVCVDGVAYAPHRLVDVRAWDVDFYVLSLYKVFGPHLGLLYGKRESLLELSNINHLFVSEDAVPYKLQPGSPNYELASSLPAIVEYLEELGRRAGGEGGARDLLAAAFDAIARHEAETVAPLLACLGSTEGVRVLGRPDSAPDGRVATVSFVAEGRSSSEVPLHLDSCRIGVRYGDFHSRRLVQDLGFAAPSKSNGVVRISLAHYNTPQEVAFLCECLGRALSARPTSSAASGAAGPASPPSAP